MLSDNQRLMLTLIAGGTVMLFAVAGVVVWLGTLRQPVRDERRPSPDADLITKRLYELKSAEASERWQAALGLKNMVPVEGRRREIVSALEARLNDPDIGVRREIADALSVWADKESVPALLRVLNNALDKNDRCDTVIHALGRLKDERAAEPLARCLEDFSIQQEAHAALIAMGSVAETAVAKRLRHRDRDVREAACGILAVIGTKESIPVLEAEVAKKDFVTSGKAEDAIRAIKARQ